MAEDQERADRIRQLKHDNPQLRWRQIADHVGVELRSAQAWQETGGISYDNAKKLADLVNVDVDWIMRGAAQRSPDMFPASQVAGDLAAVLQEIKDQLEQQNLVLDEIKRHAQAVRRMLQEQRDLKEAVDERLLMLGRAVADAHPPAAVPDHPTTPGPRDDETNGQATTPRTP